MEKVGYSINFSTIDYKTINLTAIGEIIAAVTTAYGIEPNEIYLKNRARKYVEPRHMVMFIMRHTLDISLMKIAKRFRCHHATVIHAISTMKNLIATNYDVWQKYCEIHIEKPYVEPTNPIIKDELGKNREET